MGTHMVAKYKLYKEELDVLERETWKVNGGGIKYFDIFDRREKMMAILGYKLWPRIANQDVDTMYKVLRHV